MAGGGGGVSETTYKMDAAAILPLVLLKFLPSWFQRSDSEIEEGMEENGLCPS